jgi:hypothetical protein
LLLFSAFAVFFPVPGFAPLATPVQEKTLRFSGVAGSATSNPSIAHSGLPAIITDPGAPPATSGPAARQDSCSSGQVPSRRRHFVTTLQAGTCQRRDQGSRGSSPVTARITSG